MVDGPCCFARRPVSCGEDWRRSRTPELRYCQLCLVSVDGLTLLYVSSGLMCARPLLMVVGILCASREAACLEAARRVPCEACRRPETAADDEVSPDR